MLFILVMDILCAMVKKASEEELLQPLVTRALQQRISLYADDVVIFLRPAAEDIGVTLDILQLFGEASGLPLMCRKVWSFLYNAVRKTKQSYLITSLALSQISHAST